MRARSAGSSTSRRIALRQLPVVARRHQERLLAALDDALVAVDVAAHDGRAGRHRLEEDDPEALAAGGRRDVDVGGLEQLDLLLVGDPAQELHAAKAAGHHVAPRLALQRARADHQEPAVAAGLADDAERLQEGSGALARLEAPDEEDVRAGRPASARAGRRGRSAAGRPRWGSPCSRPAGSDRRSGAPRR